MHKHTNTAIKSIIILLLFLMNGGSILSQTSENNYISSDLVPYFFKAGSISYEHMISKKSSISCEILGSIFGNGEIDKTEFKVFSIGLSYVTYINAKKPFHGSWTSVGCYFTRVSAWDKRDVAFPAYILGQKSVEISAAVGHRFHLGPIILSPLISYSLPVELSHREKKGSLSYEVAGGLGIGLEIGFAHIW